MSEQTAALRYLIRAKLRGGIRKQVGRLKSWKGALFGVVGLVLFGAWITVLVVSGVQKEQPLDPALLEGPVRIGIMLFALFSIGGALQHRGLYLPAEEIERLFAAPLRRSDLIGYRLLVNGLRAVPSVLLIGMFTKRWFPHVGFGLLALALVFQILPVLNQLSAILFGTLEKRRARIFGRLVKPLMLLVIPFSAAIGYLFVAENELFNRFDSLGALDFSGGFLTAFEHPVVRALTVPAIPFWKIMVGPDWATRIPWFALVLGVWFVLVRLTVSIPVDFRELSLETSASVAQRIRRIHSGGSMWLKVNKRDEKGSRGLMFARGPMTAIVARKCLAIARKSQGALLLSLIVLGLVLFFAQTIDDLEALGPLGPAALVASIGVLYLGSGLRFDFRDELPRMESILSWPVSRARIFAATVLPQALLVSGLLCVAITAQATLLTGWAPGVLAVIVLLPLFVFSWSALDNVVWLLAPIRTVPGQEGALVNAGRSILIVLLRGLLSIPLMVAVGVVFAGYYFLVEDGSLSPNLGLLLGTLILAGLFVILDLAWVFVGGKCLGRFDLARDRG